jgi:hypothetical protein
MGKGRLRRRLESLARRIEEHEAKIAAERSTPQPREGLIWHWQREIRGFRIAAERARKRLGLGGGPR